MSDALGRHEQIDVAHQIEMLKPVVQHVHRASEPALGDAAGHVAARRDQHRGARNGAGEHQRLVSGALDIDQHAASVADDDHTLVDDLSRVAAAQNRRALAHLERASRAISAASGVLPLPPTVRLPMLMTGAARRRLRWGRRW